MKKWILAGAGVLLLIAAVVLAVVFWPRKFSLDPEYLGGSGFEEIDVDEFRALVENKKSFAIFFYQPDCSASEDFEKVLAEFSEKENVKILKTDYVEAKHSGLVPGLKYYPSLALYDTGKLVDFLKTDEDADISAYETEAGFREWWEKYVKLAKK